jgi:orotidine-5'-phosphate decarboxylase
MAAPKLIVALDFPDGDAALSMREKLGDRVDFYKVGSELFTATGPAWVRELCRSGAAVFLDLKFHDIPATVARAVGSAARLGVDLLDVHASGGIAMMRAAVEAAEGRCLTFGVTVLTHLVDEDLREIGFSLGSRRQVVALAGLAQQAGLDGVVASAWEVEAVREATQGTLRVLVPAVRPLWSPEIHDQRRVATPAEAARSGASYVVVGRAITRAAEPREAAERIREELDSV